MITFDNLYSLDKKGKLRVFKIATQGNTIITETGLLGGKLITRTKDILKGTQGRSIFQQVQFDANSEWESKLDEGYKSREMLLQLASIRVPSYNTQGMSIQDLYSNLNIKYNTSRTWTPLPMLAETYKHGKYEFPMFAQRKYDGVRCIAIPHPVRLCSRGGKFYIGLDHIERELKSIFNLFPTIQLDGELYAHGQPMARISGACRKQTRDLFEDFTWLEYHVYDVAVPDLSQRERTNLLNTLFERLPNLEYIKFVETFEVKDFGQVKKLHDEFVADGYEGLILRQLDSRYMFSFRDNALLKVKEFKEEEFEIVSCDYDIGTGISSFTFICAMPDGREFGVRPIGSHSLWKEYLENFHDKIEGKKATVRFLNYSVNGLPEKAVVKAIRDYE